MKINEIIVEGKADADNDGIPDSQQAATPGMRSHHKLDNSSPYAPWRFAAHFLGGAGDASGEYEHQPEKEGPNGQSLIAVAYSDGDAKILDQATKAFGPEAGYKQLTPNGSSEVESVNNKSPVQARGPITLKAKESKK
jgi:hypothetical protein